MADLDLSSLGAGIGGAAGMAASEADKQKAHGLIDEGTSELDNLTPEQKAYLAALSTQGPSAFGGISDDPKVKAAQISALTALQKQYASGGLDPQAKAEIAESAAKANQNAQALSKSIADQRARQGMASSGASFADQRSAEQSAANSTNEASAQAAAAAAARALQAQQMAGTAAGQIRGQDFNEAAAKAQATDAINRFNTANSNQNSQFNANQQQGAAENSFNNGLNLNQGYQGNAKAYYGSADRTSQDSTNAGGLLGSLGKAAGMLGGGGKGSPSSSGSPSEELPSDGAGYQGEGNGLGGEGPVGGGGDYGGYNPGGTSSDPGGGWDAPSYYSTGGKVPGKAPVPVGKNSPQADRVPAMLSPGEVVVPRSITQSPDASGKAAAFVDRMLKHTAVPPPQKGKPRRFDLGGMVPDDPAPSVQSTVPVAQAPMLAAPDDMELKAAQEQAARNAKVSDINSSLEKWALRASRQQEGGNDSAAQAAEANRPVTDLLMRRKAASQGVEDQARRQELDQARQSTDPSSDLSQRTGKLLIAQGLMTPEQSTGFSAAMFPLIKEGLTVQQAKAQLASENSRAQNEINARAKEGAAGRANALTLERERMAQERAMHLEDINAKNAEKAAAGKTLKPLPAEVNQKIAGTASGAAGVNDLWSKFDTVGSTEGAAAATPLVPETKNVKEFRDLKRNAASPIAVAELPNARETPGLVEHFEEKLPEPQTTKERAAQNLLGHINNMESKLTGEMMANRGQYDTSGIERELDAVRKEKATFLEKAGEHLPNMLVRPSGSNSTPKSVSAKDAAKYLRDGRFEVMGTDNG